MITGLKSKIREIPDWPKKGINFKDITTLLEDRDSFKQVVDLIADSLANKDIDKIVGIDARGFLIAAPVAYKLNCGLAIVRKEGKLPYTTIEQEYTLEYASNVIQMHKDSISKGEKIVLIDDLLATGGTALAACDLIEKLGGEILETCFIIDLSFLNGSKRLKQKGHKVKSLVSYEKE